MKKKRYVETEREKDGQIDNRIMWSKKESKMRMRKRKKVRKERE